MIALAIGFFAGVLATQLPKHAWMHRLASRDAAVARAFAAAALPTPQRQLVEGVPVKPKIPDQWCAEASTSFVINGKPQYPSPAITSSILWLNLCSDALAKRSVQLSSQRMPLAPAALQGTGKDFTNFSMLATSNFSGYVINGETLDVSSAGGQLFRNLFDFLPAAQHGGTVTVNGTALQAWTLKYGNNSFQLLVDAAGTPVRLDQNLTIPPPSLYAGDVQLQYT